MNRLTLSDDTVHWRITSISIHQEDGLLSRLRQTEAFALQTNDSSDRQTLTYLHLSATFGMMILWKIFCFACQPLPERKTAEGMFQVWSSCYHGITWPDFTRMVHQVPVCLKSDRDYEYLNARKLLHMFGPMICSAENSWQVKTSLQSKIMSWPINDIKTKPLQARIFSSLCRDCNSDS